MKPLLSTFLLYIGFVTAITAQVIDNPLEQIITKNKATFGPWASDPSKYEVQVLYTEIDRKAEGMVTLKTHRWGSDSAQYFYPASTVKMPAAILALQWINEQGASRLTPQT